MSAEVLQNIGGAPPHFEQAEAGTGNPLTALTLKFPPVADRLASYQHGALGLALLHHLTRVNPVLKDETNHGSEHARGSATIVDAVARGVSPHQVGLLASAGRIDTNLT
ncbi:hypothetical protein L1887_57013 [Cichorium endivia]|nr:hypothetical protein L1887_57013 [Cichorium endivia]